MALPLSREMLADSVFELVRHADLNTLTSKMVRTQLEAKHELSLRDHKTQIDDIIRECLVRRRTSDAATKNDEPAASPSSDKKATNGVSQNSSTNTHDYEEDGRAASSTAATPPIDELANLIDDDIDVYSAVKRRRAAQRPVQRKPPAKKAKREPGTSGKKTAFTRICVLSDELFAVLNRRYMRRSDVVKAMWQHFRTNELLDKKDRRYVVPDESLRVVFGARRFQAFGMMKQLSPHIKDLEFLDEDTRRTALREIEELEDADGGFQLDPSLIPSTSKASKAEKITKTKLDSLSPQPPPREPSRSVEQSPIKYPIESSPQPSIKSLTKSLVKSPIKSPAIPTKSEVNAKPRNDDSAPKAAQPINAASTPNSQPHSESMAESPSASSSEPRAKLVLRMYEEEAKS